MVRRVRRRCPPDRIDRFIVGDMQPRWIAASSIQVSTRFAPLDMTTVFIA